MRTTGLKMTGFTMILALASMLGGALQANAAEVSVQAKQGFKFERSTLEVPAGSEVVLRFENTGIMAHNIKVPALNAGTETIGGGKSQTITFTVGKSGAYEFRCSVPGHAQAGMTGQIKVI
jgi:nitrite reductase (NO-forming)